MNWQQTIHDSETLCVAPAWFIEAKRLGASEKKLRSLVHDHCVELMHEKGENLPAEAIRQLWADILFDLYDNGCSGY